MNRLITLIASGLLAIGAYAQDLTDLWHHKDLSTDGVPGISLQQAYDYLDGRPSRKVVVAIIDSGFEIDHDVFAGALWVNEDEIAGNGIDDDGNGYVDDINGWNFIGGADGNVTDETLELTREYRRLQPIYADASPSNRAEYKYWKEIEADFLASSEEARVNAEGFRARYDGVTFQYRLLSGYAQVDTLTAEVLESIDSQDSVVQAATGYLSRIVAYLGGQASLEETTALFEGGLDYYEDQMNVHYNLDLDPRGIVGDNIEDLDDRFYGNNQVGETNDGEEIHGTHVAGIVGGQPDAATIGVTDNVEFMMIRTVPNGDERDKDVANSIRYAVDNGAMVINMSFGKEYSPDQEYVREAVKYAENAGVLMVHAAGNDGKNNDEKLSFPDGSISDRRKADSWIEVGASSSSYDESLPASFSNYGENSVDLFAPGVQILSSVADNGYESLSGTSMASPVVAGVAALLMSYFPELEASDIKEILMESVTKIDLEVLQPTEGDEEVRVPFSSLSRTGGIVNAYEAVKLADQRATIRPR